MDLHLTLALLVFAACSPTESKPLTCPKPNGRFPNPDDCTSFLECSSGDATIVDCPTDLTFNRMTLVCDRKDNAPCRLGEVHDINPRPFYISYSFFKCTCDCCVQPDPSDCQVFYRCEEGKAYRHKCAHGLLFNPDGKNCDFANNVKCPEPTEAPTTTVPTTTEAEPSSVADDSTEPHEICEHHTGLYPNPDDCLSFFHCSHGIAYLKDCPSGLHFNPILKVCDRPDRAGCEKIPTTPKEPITKPPTQPPTPRPTSDPRCEEEGDLLPHPTDCRKFLHCSHGVAYVKDCPSILHFNPIKKICDWPNDAGCEKPVTERTTPKEPITKPPTQPPTPRPTSDPRCEKEGDLLPHQTDCRKFLHCSHGVAYVKDCPSILHFNPIKKICDWPNDAGCEKPVTERTTPKEPITKPPTQPPTPRPTSDPRCEKEGDLLPHPTDCRKFLHCSHGVAYVKDCPSILHFNPIKKICDWPNDAGCEKPVTERTTPKEPITKPPTQPPTPRPTSDPRCEKEGDLLPHPTDCRKFLHCSHGVAYVKDCPSILHFNPIKKICDWPNDAGCEKPVTERTTPKEPITKPPTQPPTPRPTSDPRCEKEGDLLPHPTDCRKFLHCSHGVAYIKDCPSILHFNPTKKICDWPNDAGCEKPVTERTTPKEPITKPPTQPPTPRPTSDPRCEKEGDLLPHPTDCRKFLHCSHGVAYVKDCPSILHFNPIKKICDWPNDAGCEKPVTERTTPKEPITKPPTQPPTPRPTSDPRCEKEGDLLPHPTDCRKFLHCSHGVAYVKDCPSILHFNPIKKICDWPNDAGCEKPVTERTTPKEPITKPPTQPPTPRPTSDPRCEKEGDLLPHPTDCRKFLHCSHGVAYVKDCPSILHFNPIKKICDWPNDAGCEKPVTERTTPKEPITKPPTQPPTPRPTSDPRCEKEGDLLPHPTDCRKFLHCSHGVAYVKDCPSILHFNPIKKICDWPNDAGCEKPVTERTTPKEPITKPPTQPPTPRPTSDPRCEKEGDLLPHPTDCRKFLHCSHGVAYVKDCPSILHFNPIKKICDWPNDAGCEKPVTERTTPKEPITKPPTQPPTPRPTSDPRCEKEGDLLPHPTDCRKFLHCSHGVAYVKDCPSILHFNPIKKICDWPNDAGCEKPVTERTTPKEPITKPPTQPPTPRPTSDPRCEKEGDLLPHPTDCRKFLHCSHGVAYVKDCPSILHFNPIKKICDWPNDAGCEKPVTERTTPKEPITKPPTQPPTPRPTSDPRCEKEGDLLPHPTDCRKFLHCSHGVAYVKDCPSILHFNPIKKICDWPNDAGCEKPVTERTTPKEPITKPPTQPPTPRPTSDPRCEKEGDLLPHPTDCRKFLHCSHGVAYVKDCPSILHFNPIKKICDWPNDAGCEKPVTERTTPKEPITKPPTQPPTPRPTSDPRCEKEGDLLPHPTDCRKFLHCSHGVAYVKDCPSILHFNPIKKICDWPNDAGCEKPVTERTTPKEPITKPPTQPPTPRPTSDPRCEKEGDLLPHPTDCRKFLHCSHGVAYVKDCPSILHFNPIKKICDWPNDAGCEKPVTERTTPKEPITKPPTQPPTPRPTSDPRCEKEGDLLPHPTDCRKFLHCSHGVAYVKDCPSILHFNPIKKICDWPNDAGCEKPVTEKTTPKEPITKPPTQPPTPRPTSDPRCEKEGDLLPHPTDCRKFLHCSHGVAYVKDCPSILHFNPIKKICDWPNDAGCEKKPVTEPITPEPTPSPTPAPIRTTTNGDVEPPHNCTCEKPKPPPKNCTVVTGDVCKTPSGLFPNPNDCKTFFHCSHGVAYLKKCPANLHFNPVKLVCDWPQNAGCISEPIIFPTPCKTPSGLFPHPTDCTKFYHCSHGIAYLKTCPANLHFNPHLLVCDWPKEAGCVIEPTTPPPIEEDFTGPPEVCVTPSGLFPHPTDCHKFYHCAHGIAYEKVCPANLHFNPDLLVCDWPEEAGCKNHDECAKPSTNKPRPTRPVKPTDSTKPPGTRPPRPTRPTKPTKPSKPNPSQNCHKEGDLLPDPRDCGRFFHCSHGIPHSKKCPDNLHFNPIINVCDWPEKAGCRKQAAI